MTLALTSCNRDEWPTRLFKMRGFARAEVRYDGPRDRMYVVLERRLGDAADAIDLPDGYRAMTLEAFRSWVDREVDKLGGQSDYPTVSFNHDRPAP